MMNYSRLIDDYILGTLSEENRKAFEMELAINPELRKEVKLCMELQKSIYEDDVFTLREKLKLSQKSFSKARANRRAILISLVSAASIMLIFGLKFFFVDNTPNHEQLYSQFFQPYKILGDSRGNNHSNTNNYSDNNILPYTTGDYEQVMPWLEKQFTIDSNNFEIILMLTTAYLETNNAEKAEEILLTALHNKSNIAYTETITWYLALAVLRQGKTEEVKPILEKIYNNKGLYSKKALNILESLNKNSSSNKIGNE